MKQENLLTFILSNKRYRKQLWIATAGTILQLILFKILYPFPDFISDSYNYIETSRYHMPVNLWPVGYAHFLGILHAISPSPGLLVVVQHLLLIASLLYFYFTIRRLYPLPKTHGLILYLFLFFNPVFLFLSNCVLSDALFSALSIVLFTQYLYMLRQPKLSQLLLQTLVIFLAFTIRYTAIYYPLVSLAALLLSRFSIKAKLAGIVAPWLLIMPFIWYTQQQTKQLTGTAEFSVFGGWQIANNALYMYDHITVDSTQLPRGTENLDKMAKYYFKHIAPQNPPLTDIQGTYFIKMPNAILKPYLSFFGAQKPGYTGFQVWGSVSPIYKAYGTWLIKQHPLAFARYYLLLNTENYFLPYLEKFGSYNVGATTMREGGQQWFQLPSNNITPIPSIQFQGYLFYIYPALFLALNIIFIVQFCFFAGTRQFLNQHKLLNYSILLAGFFLLVNFGFSVFATPVVLRYQLIPMILLLCFNLLLAAYPSQSKVKHSPAP